MDADRHRRVGRLVDEQRQRRVRDRRAGGDGAGVEAEDRPVDPEVGARVEPLVTPPVEAVVGRVARVVVEIGVLPRIGAGLQQHAPLAGGRQGDGLADGRGAVGDDLVGERLVRRGRRVPVGGDRDVADGRQQRRRGRREGGGRGAVDLVAVERRPRGAVEAAPAQVGAVAVQDLGLGELDRVGGVGDVELRAQRCVAVGERAARHLGPAGVERLGVALDEEAVVDRRPGHPALHGARDGPRHPVVAGADRQRVARQRGRVPGEGVGTRVRRPRRGHAVDVELMAAVPADVAGGVDAPVALVVEVQLRAGDAGPRRDLAEVELERAAVGRVVVRADPDAAPVPALAGAARGLELRAARRRLDGDGRVDAHRELARGVAQPGLVHLQRDRVAAALLGDGHADVRALVAAQRTARLPALLGGAAGVVGERCVQDERRGPVAGRAERPRPVAARLGVDRARPRRGQQEAERRGRARVAQHQRLLEPFGLQLVLEVGGRERAPIGDPAARRRGLDGLGALEREVERLAVDVEAQEAGAERGLEQGAEPVRAVAVAVAGRRGAQRVGRRRAPDGHDARVDRLPAAVLAVVDRARVERLRVRAVAVAEGLGGRGAGGDDLLARALARGRGHGGGGDDDRRDEHEQLSDACGRHPPQPHRS